VRRLVASSIASPEEIVVYDVGSTDHTRTCSSVTAKNSFTQRHPQRGPPHVDEAIAVQAAFAASRVNCSSSWRATIGSSPTKSNANAAAFQTLSEASLIQAPLERIDQTGAVIRAVVEPRYHISNHLREIYRHQDLDFFYPASALAFSRSFLERTLPLDLSDQLPLGLMRASVSPPRISDPSSRCPIR